jgi:hypothetical protein
LCGACGGDPSLPPVAGGVALVLELPQGMYDPKGFAAIEVVLHEPAGDVRRSASLGMDGTFDLGAIDPSEAVSVEATLRSDSGAVVGYGRTAMAAALSGGAMVVVPVRRPIVYFAGTVNRDADGDGKTPNDQQWTEASATFSDLSVGGNLDGKAVLAGPAVMMIGAGPSVYMITQGVDATTGALTGAARIAPIAAADHTVETALAGAMTGAVLDGAGSDDGAALVVGTTTQLFAVDTAAGTATALADGSFARVAIVGDGDGLSAIAIRNRGATTATCATTAELWWAPLTGVTARTTSTAHLVATGGFADVAADRGHAYYIDACSGELGEVTSAAVHAIRTIATGGGASRPTALAVSNNQAYLGVETAPATTSLVFASLTTDESRTLWNESAQQVLTASDPANHGVQRQLDATAAVFNHLEIGAGGDYVALTTSAHFHGARINAANFPDMTIDTDELRVFDAATGGIVERYRSWCDGVLIESTGDILNWECSSTAGQTEAASADLEHHISSMTFLYGKK